MPEGQRQDACRPIRGDRRSGTRALSTQLQDDPVRVAKIDAVAPCRRYRVETVDAEHSHAIGQAAMLRRVKGNVINARLRGLVTGAHRAARKQRHSLTADIEKVESDDWLRMRPSW